MQACCLPVIKIATETLLFQQTSGFTNTFPSILYEIQLLNEKQNINE